MSLMPDFELGSQHAWIFLLITTIITVGAVAFVGPEEQGCLEHYGDAYRKYMNRTACMQH